MPGLTELTVVGETGQIRIQLEDSHDLTVSDILTATAPACTGIPAASVDEAIEAGHLQLLDGTRELTADEPVDAIDNDPVTVKLLSGRAARPRVLRAADAPPATPLPPPRRIPRPRSRQALRFPRPRSPPSRSSHQPRQQGRRSRSLSCYPVKRARLAGWPVRTARSRTAARSRMGCPRRRR